MIYVTSFISHFRECGDWPVGGSFQHNYDGKDFKRIFWMFLVCYQTGQWQTLKNLQLQWRKQFSRRIQLENTLCCWMTLTLREWINNTEKLMKLNSSNLSKISSQKNQKGDNNMQLTAKAVSAWKIMIVLRYFSKREVI